MGLSLDLMSFVHVRGASEVCSSNIGPVRRSASTYATTPADDADTACNGRAEPSPAKSCKVRHPGRTSGLVSPGLIRRDTRVMSRAAVTGRRTLAGLARAARYAGLIVAFGLATSGFLAAAEKVPRVVATTKPIHSIVSAVLGDAGKAELLITGMTSPHAYALKPSDASLLNAADMFVRVSEQVEPFT